MIKKTIIVSFFILVFYIISFYILYYQNSPLLNYPLSNSAPGCMNSPRYGNANGSRNVIKYLKVENYPDKCVEISPNTDVYAILKVSNKCPSEKKLLVNNILIPTGMARYFDFRKNSEGNIYSYVVDPKEYKYPNNDQNIVIHGEYDGKPFTITYTLTKYLCGSENGNEFLMF